MEKGPAPQSKARETWLIYAGPRHYKADQSTYYLYYELPSLEQNTAKASTKDLKDWRLDSKIAKKSYIGGIYAVSVEDRTVRFKTDAFAVDYWKNTVEDANWQALETAWKGTKVLKDELQRNKMIDALQPLRDAYKEASVDGKRAILAETFRIITT